MLPFFAIIQFPNFSPKSAFFGVELVEWVLSLRQVIAGSFFRLIERVGRRPAPKCEMSICKTSMARLSAWSKANRETPRILNPTKRSLFFGRNDDKSGYLGVPDVNKDASEMFRLSMFGPGLTR